MLAHGRPAREAFDVEPSAVFGTPRAPLSGTGLAPPEPVPRLTPVNPSGRGGSSTSAAQAGVFPLPRGPRSRACTSSSSPGPLFVSLGLGRAAESQSGALPGLDHASARIPCRAHGCRCRASVDHLSRGPITFRTTFDGTPSVNGQVLRMSAAKSLNRSPTWSTSPTVLEPPLCRVPEAASCPRAPPGGWVPPTLAPGIHSRFSVTPPHRIPAP